MSQQTIAQRLEDIIIDQLCVDRERVKPEAYIRADLGADSLDQAELIMAIEEEFRIEISDKEAEPLTTVGKLAEYLDKVVR